MNRMTSSVACLLVCLTCVGRAEGPSNPIVIPLDTIWAYRMPSTRDVRELSPKNDAAFSQIADALSIESPSWPKKGGSANRGFVVSGSPVDALKVAHSIIVDGNEPKNEFKATDKLNIVFFSHSFESYVQIQQVERIDRSVAIRYRVEPHAEKHVTPSFAIIPLGTLSLGKYDVSLVPIPWDQQFTEKGYQPLSNDFRRRMICGSFSFDVEDR